MKKIITTLFIAVVSLVVLILLWVAGAEASWRGLFVDAPFLGWPKNPITITSSFSTISVPTNKQSRFVQEYWYKQAGIAPPKTTISLVPAEGANILWQGKSDKLLMRRFGKNGPWWAVGATETIGETKRVPVYVTEEFFSGVPSDDRAVETNQMLYWAVVLAGKKGAYEVSTQTVTATINKIGSSGAGWFPFVLVGEEQSTIVQSILAFISPNQIYAVIYCLRGGTNLDVSAGTCAHDASIACYSNDNCDRPNVNWPGDNYCDQHPNYSQCVIGQTLQGACNHPDQCTGTFQLQWGPGACEASECTCQDCYDYVPSTPTPTPSISPTPTPTLAPGVTPTSPPVGACASGWCGGSECANSLVTWEAGPFNNCGAGLGCCTDTSVPAGCDTDWSACTDAGGNATRTDANRCADPRTQICMGAVYARAWIVPTGSTCTTVSNFVNLYNLGGASRVAAATAAAAGTQFGFIGTGNAAVSKVQGGAAYTDMRQSLDQQKVDEEYFVGNQGYKGSHGGDWTLTLNIPGNFMVANVCPTLTKANPANLTTVNGLTVNSFNEGAAGDLIRFDIGIQPGPAWAQVRGGDVTAVGGMQQLVSAIANPRKFVLDATNGTPGLVTYSGSFDFDVNTAVNNTGSTYVSSTNWLGEDESPAPDYFSLFYKQLGAPIEESALNPLFLAKPTSGTHYFKGPVLTDGTTWNIANGETIIIIVDDSENGSDGDFTVNNEIHVAKGGFFAVITKHNINVNPEIGVPLASSTPVVEGVYVTGSNGIFDTGDSLSGTERFVGKGTFVAGGFKLSRDLTVTGDANANGNASAELFIYNPDILMYMPDSLKDISVFWQEVAP